VRAIPGRMTAMLRGKFGLNQLLSGSELKNRNDHRHHALDAAVIGITDQGLLQRFAQASEQARARQLDRLVEDMPLPWANYREHVMRGLQGITVSHKPDHGYQGPMHEDTAWGLREGGQVSRLVRPEGGGQRARETKNKSVIQINSTRNLDRHGLDDNGQPNAYKGYVGGSNFCLEIWRDEKGKWNGDVVSTFTAYQVIRELGEEAGLTRLMQAQTAQNGQTLVMRLMINDLVRMEVDGCLRTLRMVKIFSSGQFFMCDHNEANVDARDKDKGDSFNYISKMPGSFQKAKGRRMTTSPTGDVRDPGCKG